MTFGTAVATNTLFDLLLLMSFTSNFTMSKHHSPSINPTYTEQVMDRFHEVNELYDGTLNHVHHIILSTKIGSNKCFTLQQATKQEDKLSFVEAMEKEINNHESRNHWSIIEQTTIPSPANQLKLSGLSRENKNQMTSC